MDEYVEDILKRHSLTTEGGSKTLKNLNRDETNPTDHLLSSIAPKFSDLKIEDITFELDKKKNEVLVEYKGEETIRYWLDVEKIGDKIKCHYSFKEGINYFELKDGQIVNTKKTLYIDKPSHTKVVEYQYKQSIYWYDNFYFNYEGRGGVYR